MADSGGLFTIRRWAIEEYSKYLLKDLRERIYYLLSLFFDEEIDLTILGSNSCH